ncbi:MAG: hypothetical protein K5911_08595 [Eubacteriales bacterium]|nr:hypothetical protein [Eubacteriales bacterium]
MPLIRYRTGDIARISSEECPCGGVLPRLETIRGRLSNSFLIQGKRVFLSLIEEAVYSDPAAADLECCADGETVSILIRTVGGESVDRRALLERLVPEILPEGTRITVAEEGVDSLAAERSAKKRLGEARHE